MKDRVKKVLSDVLDVPIADIGDDASPETLDGWDSVNHISLVMAIEEEFEVQFDDDQIPELLSFRDLVAALQREAD